MIRSKFEIARGLSAMEDSMPRRSVWEAPFCLVQLDMHNGLQEQVQSYHMAGFSFGISRFYN